MRYQNFCGPTGAGRSQHADISRTVNLFAERNDTPGAKSEWSLYHTPGLALAATTALAPVWTLTRGFALAGAGPIHLYTYTGTDLGAIPGTINRQAPGGHPYEQPPFMISNNTQLFIGGQGITPAIYDISGGTWTNLATAFTALGFFLPYWPNWATFIDGYFICGGGNGPMSNQFFISNLNDGTVWNPLNFASTQDGADSIVAGIALRRELWLFGVNRTEIYYDSGSTFPFSRVPGAVLEVGTSAPGTVQTIGGSIYFAGTNGQAGVNQNTGHASATYPQNNQLTVFRTNGYNAERISTHAIEAQMRTWATTGTAQAYVYQQDGHVFYCINPNQTSSQINGATLCYDLTTGLWHERTSPLESNLGHPVVAVAPATGSGFENQLIAASNEYGGTGKLYVMSSAIYQDAGLAVTRTRIPPLVADENETLFFDDFTLDCEVGQGVGGSINQSFTLSWSNTGIPGAWSGSSTLTLPFNNPAPYLFRFIWRRLGKSRIRAWMISTTDNLAVCITGAFLNMRSSGPRGDGGAQ